MTSLVRRAGATVLEHVQDGRFQTTLCVAAAGSSFVSGLEVGYEHYKGSYGNRLMYTPVLLSGLLTMAAGAGAASEWAARTLLRWISVATFIDGGIGFIFHIRGIARKPGGWRLPLTNIIMGPPLFAPVLFGTAAYLGFMASYLRRETEAANTIVDLQPEGWRRELQTGQFQKHLILISLLWAGCSGFEAWYSHYKNGFRIWSQWTPVILAPLHMAACLAGLMSAGAAKKLLPVTSGLAIVDGTIGFGYHVRGILRRPGGRKHWVYNILYGPPVFAPLLFAACGALGALASMLRREK